jgi:hypothetical protein
MGVVDDGHEHFAGAMDFECFLNEEPFATVVMSLELDLESLAKDAQSVVVGVEGAIDDGRDHAFWVVMDQRLFQNAFARAGFAEYQAKAALLSVDVKDVEDFLLVREQSDGFGVERISLQAKVRANHKN